jgi:3-oxoacyl-[acyl-carrier protein] reductase
MTHERVALVTGAARNIGRAIALQLAADGFGVVVNTRADLERAQAVAAEIAAAGGRAWAVAADVSDPRAVQAMADEVRERAGRVDVLVNNAAIRPRRPFLELTFEEWRAVVAVILDGAFLCSRAFLPGMADQGFGRIVNIIGLRGEHGVPERVHLSAAKNGLIGLTRALASEFGPHGVTVNAVSPGTIETERDRLDPAARIEARAAGSRVGRLGRPEDVAAVVAFLASERAGYTTGQVIGVNGGEPPG